MAFSVTGNIACEPRAGKRIHVNVNVVPLDRACLAARVGTYRRKKAYIVQCQIQPQQTDAAAAAAPFVHNKEELEQLVLEKPLVFCFVHAPWCKACKKIKTDGLFDRAADQFPRVTGVQCDVEAAKDLKPMLGVRSVPAFVVYREGKRIDHFNAKTLEDIVEQMADYAA